MNTTMAATQSAESVESKLLRESRGTLHDLISGSIINLSVKATSANLLTKEEQEKCSHLTLTDGEQANQFMRYISNKVSSDPSTLEVFIEKVLGKEGTFQKFAQELLAKLNNAKAKEEHLTAPVQETGVTETGEQDESGSGFTESMDKNALTVWLRSKSISQIDTDILREQEVSGDCFMDLSDGEMKDFKLSFGGRKSIRKLQNTIREGAGATALVPIGVNTLEINHLRFLVNETWDARNKWNHIGRELGIDQNSLDSIDNSKRGKAEDCYPEMLSTWVRRDGATWDALLDVLALPAVDLAIIATQIKSLSDEKKQKICYYC